ncbi:MAG: cytochrome c [Cryomorphaceae bacterium]
MKSTIMNKLFLFFSIACITSLTACSDGEDEAAQSEAEPMEIYTPKAKASPLGIGPITEEVTFGTVDPAMVAEGEAVFTQMCTACHKLDKRHVGPALADVLERRNPAWVMNMILNPEVMVKEDPVAKQLFAEYLSPMANQNLTVEQARAVVEYIRQYNPQSQQ